MLDAEVNGLSAPRSHNATIHMNKIRAAVFADATCLAGCRRAEHLADRAGGKAQVSRLAFHVEGVLGNAARSRPQHRIGLRAAITGQQHVGFVYIKKVVRRGHDVERARVDGNCLIRAPVAHEVVDLTQGVFDVITVDPIHHVKAFAGPAGIHANASDIACAAKETRCI